MRYSSSPLIVLAAGILASISQDAATAQEVRHRHDSQAAALEASRRGQIRPLPEILASVRQRVPGDVIDVELDVWDRQLVYEVKVLTVEGRVIEVDVDAREGVILRDGLDRDREDKDARSARSSRRR